MVAILASRKKPYPHLFGYWATGSTKFSRSVAVRSMPKKKGFSVMAEERKRGGATGGGETVPRCRKVPSWESMGNQQLGLASPSVVITLTASDKYQRVLKRALWKEESIDSANLVPAVCQDCAGSGDNR